MASLQGIDDAALMSRVLEYYQTAAPLIEASFAQTPIVFRHYPNGIDENGVFHVTTVPLTADKLLWLIHAEYAVEFYTWAPTLLDTDRLRFGRILLEAPPEVGGLNESSLRRWRCARCFLTRRSSKRLVPLLDGGAGNCIVDAASRPDAPATADARCAGGCTNCAGELRSCTPTWFRTRSIPTMTAGFIFMCRATPQATTAPFRTVCAPRV